MKQITWFLWLSWDISSAERVHGRRKHERRRKRFKETNVTANFSEFTLLKTWRTMLIDCTTDEVPCAAFHEGHNWDSFRIPISCLLTERVLKQTKDGTWRHVKKLLLRWIVRCQVTGSRRQIAKFTEKGLRLLLRYEFCTYSPTELLCYQISKSAVVN